MYIITQMKRPCRKSRPFGNRIFDTQEHDYHKICDNLRFLFASICENKDIFMFHAKAAKY